MASCVDQDGGDQSGKLCSRVSCFHGHLETKDPQAVAVVHRKTLDLLPGGRQMNRHMYVEWRMLALLYFQG